jgi:hypothetical protein
VKQKIHNIYNKIFKMTNETLRMQMLAGVITEGQYKAKLQENAEKASLNESMIGGIVGVGAINQIPPRAKADYEMAFEHFLGERYMVRPNRERDDIKDVNEAEDGNDWWVKADEAKGSKGDIVIYKDNLDCLYWYN